MEIEDENPLQINNKTSGEVNTKNFKNIIGRPKKSNEIRFSSQPKSIVSIFLCNEQTKFSHSKFKPDDELCTKSIDMDLTCNIRIPNRENKCNNTSSHKNVYKCDYKNCTYTTKFSSNLKTHKRMHTLERPYACDECIFRTNFISSLKTHKRLHGKERPFACQHCDYKCNSGSNLKKHCSRKHYNKN